MKIYLSNDAHKFVYIFIDKTKTTIFRFLQILLEDSICLKEINKNED